MPLATLLAALFVGLFIGWRKARARSRHAEEMWRLRFPTVYEKSSDGSGTHCFVDFKEMLLVQESYDYKSHKTRVYHLRRRDGPTWESREDERIAEMGDTALLLVPPPDERATTVEAESWSAVDFPTLEESYQRFVADYRDDVYFRLTPLSIALEEDWLYTSKGR